LKQPKYILVDNTNIHRKEDVLGGRIRDKMSFGIPSKKKKKLPQIHQRKKKKSTVSNLRGFR